MAPKSDCKWCATTLISANYCIPPINASFLGHHFYNYPFWAHTRINPPLVQCTNSSHSPFLVCLPYLIIHQKNKHLLLIAITKSWKYQFSIQFLLMFDHHIYVSLLLELSVKSFKEGQNRGSDPSLSELSMKSSLTPCVLDTILKVGCKFWDLFFPPLKLRECLDLKQDMHMRLIILNPTSAYSKLA